MPSPLRLWDELLAGIDCTMGKLGVVAIPVIVWTSEARGSGDSHLRDFHEMLRINVLDNAFNLGLLLVLFLPLMPSSFGFSRAS